MAETYVKRGKIYRKYVDGTYVGNVKELPKDVPTRDFEVEKSLPEPQKAEKPLTKAKKAVKSTKS